MPTSSEADASGWGPEKLAAMWADLLIRLLVAAGWRRRQLQFVGRDKSAGTSTVTARLRTGHVLCLEFREDSRGFGWYIVAVALPDGSPGPADLPEALAAPSLTKAQVIQAIKATPTLNIPGPTGFYAGRNVRLVAITAAAIAAPVAALFITRWLKHRR